jgi:hypothetical protein
MQLHPADPANAMRYAVQSLAAGFIGLDFEEEIGDLSRLERDDVPAKQRDYWDFAHKMKKGDLVLVIVHHFPFALARVTGSYNYIREPATELGVWFRHFRPVESLSYYADVVTDLRTWEQLRMTDTISILVQADSKSRQLIDSWQASIKRTGEPAA